LHLKEQLGVRYERCLVPLPRPAGRPLRNAKTGAIHPVQSAPAMPGDDGCAGPVGFTVVDLEPWEDLQLRPADAKQAETPLITVCEGQGSIIILNGPLGVQLTNGSSDATPAGRISGPIQAVSLDGSNWFGESVLNGVPAGTEVSTEVESAGPCLVQWRTSYKWGGIERFVFRARWAAGADTIQAVEEMHAAGGCAVDWFPLARPSAAMGEDKARAYWWGGGEGEGPMQLLDSCPWDETPIGAGGGAGGAGRRVLQRLSHISYFNQWNAAWVGFSCGDERFVGVFSGWGGLWLRRGLVRPEILLDEQHGAMLRFPLAEGRRLYGIVLSSKFASGLEAKTGKCLLNRRKLQLSDLRLSKVRAWELQPRLEKKTPHLVLNEDVAGLRARLASDPSVAAALEAFPQQESSGHRGELAAAFWKGDEERMRRWGAAVAGRFEEWMRRVASGGYEALCIFHGREFKSLAFDLDLLWARRLISAELYRRARAAFLAAAYMFSDPDYCNYSDFQTSLNTEGAEDREEKTKKTTTVPLVRSPSESLCDLCVEKPGEDGFAAAMKNEMGDAPVPPNFSAEFFSTVGVAAELFDRHPLREEWRRWAMQRTDEFLDNFFESDGTYHESINYHGHAVSELVCYFYPLWAHGVRDYFAHPRVRGSFEHFTQIQMPPLTVGQSSGLPPSAGPVCTRAGRLCVQAGWDMARLAPFPADGNSGGHGQEQELRCEMTTAARVYQGSDPALAGALMHTWRSGGKPLQDLEHPLLTLLTLDPRIESRPAAWQSTWRKSLGVISKAVSRGGEPLWCLFRAGRATHHMDFDQGNLHLAFAGRVLLGDHGYHTEDADGTPLAAPSTWLHSTLTYGPDRNLSSGYTGLEEAPEPLLVQLSDKYDWCVHRIVNTNYRDMAKHSYRCLLPAPRTVHVRHYLFVKPDYFLIWDVLEEWHGPATFWLHAPRQFEAAGPAAFISGNPGEPHLAVQFLLPPEPRVVENRRVGPLWCLGVSGAAFMSLLVPQIEDRNIRARLGKDGRTVTVKGNGIADTVLLGKGGGGALPILQRN